MTTTEKTGTLRRRTVLAAVAGIGFAAAADRGEATTAELVDLQVIDRETGQPARLWRHAGRLYVAGRPGARYSLRVTNNSSGRVLAVLSVDGVNILTGETAGYGQRGYVFEPWQSYDISGWRKSDTEVAAFTFAPLPRSYAARTGRPGEVGVIGVAAFRERTAPPVAVSAPPRAEPRIQPRVATESRAGEDVVVTGSAAARAPAAPPLRVPAPSAQVARAPEKLGTGHGAREWSVARTVPFERATAYPQLIRRIEYDSHENLMLAGVIPRPRPTPPRPRPFPSSPGGYVPDPPHG